MVKNMPLVELSNIGIVVSEEENGFILQIDYRRKLATKALSCLVHPSIGDKVRLFFDEKEIYITDILSSKNLITIQAKEITFDVENINFKSKVFDINVQYIHSKVSLFNAFIKKIDLCSLFTKFASTDIQITAQTKKEFTQFRVNHYETLDTKVSAIEKKEVNIVKKNINIEHKNVGSMFTKATGQIKLDAENINLG